MRMVLSELKQILKVSDSYPIRRFRGLSKGARKIHMRLLGVPNWEEEE